MSTKATIDEWVREAYATSGDCPPPELLLPEELGQLDSRDRQRLESHVKGCSACAAERELAAAFEVPADLSAAERREVERIADRLAPHRRRIGLLERLGLASVGSLLRTPAFQFAAAAVLVLVVGFAVQTGSPPDLGDAPSRSVVRGSTLTTLVPVGDLDEAPIELSWEAVEGTAHYLVTLRGVDDEILGQATTEATRLPLGSLLEGSVLPAVTYVWSVEAQSAEGEVVARSSATRFQLRP